MMKAIYTSGRWIRSILGVVVLTSTSCAVNDGDSTSVEEMLEHAVTLEDGRLIVDQDILVPSREAARQYLQRELHWASARARLARSEELGEHSAPLTQSTPGGVPSRWEFPANTQITYCVNEASFDGRAAELISALEAAMTSWSRVANVRFERRNVDTCNRSADEVVFNVRKSGSNDFIASAFFPDYAREDRELLVTIEAFDSELATLVGILEHELGHVLGFRHEHIWVSCTVESTFEATALTPYDVNSVMHYPQCRPSGGGGLSLSDLDRRGVIGVYGLAPALISVI